MQSKIRKSIAIILAIVMLYSVFAPTTIYAADILLENKKIEEQGVKTNNDNVEFDVHYSNGKHENISNISEENIITLKLAVKNSGYIKDAKVIFENANFTILKEEVKDEKIISITDNSITFSQINSGESLSIPLKIKALSGNIVNSEMFARNINANFTAQYVNNVKREVNIKATRTLHQSWSATPEIELDQKILGSKTYQDEGINNSEDNNIAVIQAKVTSKIKDNILPVKSEKLEITAPTLDGLKPYKATVIANTTVATNGDLKAYNFTSDNWNYDVDTGKVTINVKNSPNADGNIAWYKNVADDFIITYMYSKELSSEKMENTSTYSSVDATFVVYNKEETILRKSFATGSEQRMSENITVLDVKMNLIESKLSKGYMYNNLVAAEENKRTTNYTENYHISIYDPEIANGVTIKQEGSALYSEDEAKFSDIINYFTYNGKMKIDKWEFDKILGSEGYIQILDKETLANIAAINANTLPDENGKLVVDISEFKANNIQIDISKPIVAGNLEVEVEKSIGADFNYSTEFLKNFKKLKVTSTNVLTRAVLTDSLELTEPEAKAEITVSNTNLSTVLKNENVMINVVLAGSLPEDMLWKNPTLKIYLPQYISEINIKSFEVLYNDGLTVAESILDEENGTKVIKLRFEGTQTAYINEMLKGLTIAINTDITLNRLTPSREEKVVMIVTNDNVNQDIVKEVPVNLVAPSGLITVNYIENYSDSGEKVLTINGENKEGTLDVYSSVKEVSVTEQVINNFDNSISNVKILGQIPSEGQNKLDTNQSLENNFNATLNSPVQVQGVNATVYYSKENNPSKDLNDQKNGWTTALDNLADAKSYLIDVSEDEINKGDVAQVTYKMTVPENLPHNRQVTTNYKTYYTNNSEIGVVDESITSSDVKLTTGEGVELKAQLASGIEDNGTIRAGQYVMMRLEVENIGKILPQNPKATITLPDGVYFVSYDRYNEEYKRTQSSARTFDLGEIGNDEVESSPIINYIIEVTNEYLGQDQSEKDLTVRAVITADNMEIPLTTNNYNFKVKTGSVRLTSRSSYESGSSAKKGEQASYSLKVENISLNNVNNVEVNIPLPSGVDVNDAYYYLAPYGKKVKINDVSKIIIDEIPSNKYVEVIVGFTPKENIEERFESTASAKLNSEVYYANSQVITKGNSGIKAKANTDGEKYVKERETFDFVYTINTLGNTELTNLKLTSKLPNNAKYISTSVESVNPSDYILNPNIEERDGVLNVSLGSVKPDVELQVKLAFSGNIDAANGEDLKVTNSAIVSADEIQDINLNSGVYHVQYVPRYHINISNPGDDIQEVPDVGEKAGRYRIIGDAWEDINANGRRDADESKKAGITVTLLSKETNQVVKDADTNEIKATTTDSNGSYSFRNLLPGNYVVVFIYDNNVYKLTEYKKQGVEDTHNSDAIESTINLNGEDIRAGITDTITIKDDYARNIDIGLVPTEKFDLKLDKYISKLTVTTPSTGTNSKDYDNKSIVKTEIRGKEAGNSSMVIEYKIVITNEGNIPGYVKSVVDYLPAGAKFSSELNTDWYESDNGNLYSNSLANVKINPGESKELKLVTTFKITEESIGTVVSNKAEIYESYNEYGIKDIDSTENNKIENEDDMSVANIIISVRTGQTVLYAALIITVVTILTVGIYEIKKRVFGN